MTTETVQVNDPGSGQNMPYTFDPETSPPEEFFSLAGKAMENQNREGSIKGWRESRYFESVGDYQTYVQWRGETPSQIAEWFESAAFEATASGKNWLGLDEDSRQLQIEHARLRILKDYRGNPYGANDASGWPLAFGPARCAAELREGLVPGEALY
jgi:hypothetical protein